MVNEGKLNADENGIYDNTVSQEINSINHFPKPNRIQLRLSFWCMEITCHSATFTDLISTFDEH